MAIKSETTTVKSVDFAGNEKTTTTNIMTVQCDGPKCDGKNGCKSFLTWVETGDTPEKALESIPDDVFRVLTVQDGLLTPPKRFFSRNCLKEYMRDIYVVPRSPREVKADLDAQMAKAKEIVEQKAAVTQSDGFGEDDLA